MASGNNSWEVTFSQGPEKLVGVNYAVKIGETIFKMNGTVEGIGYLKLQCDGIQEDEGESSKRWTEVSGAR